MLGIPFNQPFRSHILAESLGGLVAGTNTLYVTREAVKAIRREKSHKYHRQLATDCSQFQIIYLGMRPKVSEAHAKPQ